MPVTGYQVIETVMPTVAGEWRYLYRKGQRDLGPSMIQFACPCGCGQVGGISLQPAEPDGWQLRRTGEQPSVWPSIRRLEGCKWHGYLTDGVWESC